MNVLQVGPYPVGTIARLREAMEGTPPECRFPPADIDGRDDPPAPALPRSPRRRS